jgi:predicted transcriptional regulator of viral defense system
VKLTDAHARLLRLGVSTFHPNDAAALWGIRRDHASQLLGRLAAGGHVVRLARGRYALPTLAPFALPQALSSPSPSYVSFHSALYHHGLLEQVPAVIYAATLSPTRRVGSPLGVVSFHQLSPEFFGGYAYDSRSTGEVATPEKALVDYLYLGPTKSRLFRALPELELPRSFRRKEARRFVRSIASVARRAFVSNALDRILDS